MAVTFFDDQRALVMAGMAREAGVDPAAYARETLTVVLRPDPPVWAYSAMICTFGTGTTISVDPAFLDWVRTNRPEKHFRAFSHAFLDRLVAEAASRGERLNAHTGALGFALAALPRFEPIEGYRFEFAGPEWMTAERATGIFHNAVGRPDESYRTSQYRFAIIARELATGGIAAVAGVFDTSGLHEIGVDVARPYRGTGLSNAVVSRAIAAIIEIGGTPFYSCGVTNIRSQRTALANGFLPCCSMGYVAPIEAGDEEAGLV